MTETPRHPVTGEYVNRQAVVEGQPLTTPTATEKGTAGELPHHERINATPTAAQQERNLFPHRGNSTPGSQTRGLIARGPQQASVIRISSDKE